MSYDIDMADGEWPTASIDYTLDIPPIEGTVAAHPARCDCSPCSDRAEFADWTRKMDALRPTGDYGSLADWQRETARDDIANGFG